MASPSPPVLAFAVAYTHAPASLGIELVRGCNFDCPMCPVTANAPGEPQKFQFIALDVLERVVDQIDRHPSIRLVWFFHFGEPMAHPQYERCLEILHRSPVARAAEVVQHTNASLLHGARAEAILDVPVITKLVFSFDGWGDRESFERMRGPHYDRVLGNIREFAGKAATRRPDLKLATCSIIPRSGELGVDAPPVTEAHERLSALFAGTGVTIQPRSMHAYNGGDALALRAMPAAEVRGGCTFVERDDLYVTVNGWAQPCCSVYDERFNVGHVNAADLVQLMNSDAMRAIRHDLRLGRRDRLKHCSTCTLSLATVTSDAELRTFWRERIAAGAVSDADELAHLERTVFRAAPAP
jgi:hypothetical protein